MLNIPWTYGETFPSPLKFTSPRPYPAPPETNEQAWHVEWLWKIYPLVPYKNLGSTSTSLASCAMLNMSFPMKVRTLKIGTKLNRWVIFFIQPPLRKNILNTWGHISAWVMSQIPHSSIYWYFPALQSNMFNIWRKLACGVIIANLPRFDLTRQNASFIICEKFPRGVILLIYPPLYLQNRTFCKTPGSTYEPARHPESCLKCLLFPYSNTLNKWTELAPRAMFGIYAHCTHHTQQYIRQMD